ncbi:hypothetical protein F7734_10285 [Scytonema sp. UIC 10036]|uniref:hypothetical protein n=1 Tax=Scytonema sp. UIC 10036 TaxID=2304196 RepID=UPI0012DA1DE1|nr:hypothetical protein [Scytonema sp. UIC 10036]MUG92816.1 hypothetical protein [Scytonema sp. UIC 10036]
MIARNFLVISSRDENRSYRLIHPQPLSPQGFPIPGTASASAIARLQESKKLGLYPNLRAVYLEGRRMKYKKLYIHESSIILGSQQVYSWKSAHQT